MGLNVKTVTKWINRFDGEDSVVTRQRSGRPIIITGEDGQRIVQTVMERLHLSVVDLTPELGLPCNPETTRRHLNENGFRCCIPAKKEKLSRENKVARLEFARRYTQDV
ncbi:uncharacterized protein [Palaemon carinicauda]|uniref:uncharacterized protein n=1 Tax=Palaemon carinicauda TaxID=392227 RepID=UPI0035B586C4